ncbi:MAG: hypothetical protein E6Q97_22885 [Desulfurellales bacterium]|nr:MAG: hypothetical protein E6Q97_22885 [Desulfurellales bacterium]
MILRLTLGFVLLYDSVNAFVVLGCGLTTVLAKVESLVRWDCGWVFKEIANANKFMRARARPVGRFPRAYDAVAVWLLGCAVCFHRHSQIHAGLGCASKKQQMMLGLLAVTHALLIQQMLG